MRIKDLGNTATDFASDDYIGIDGATNGSRKLKNDSLLNLAAQNAIAGNLAPAFDPTKPNDASGFAYYADEFVTYNGKFYQFAKNKASGAWSSSYVKAVSVNEIFLTKFNFSKKIETKTLAGEQKTNTSTNLNISFVPNKRQFKLVVHKKAYGSSTGAVLYLVDSTGTNPLITYTAFKYDYQVISVTIPSGYDTIWIYNSATASTIDVEVYYINEDSTDTILENLNDYVLGTYRKKWELKEANTSLNWRIYPEQKQFKLKVKKINYSGVSTFGVYYQDSTGTNPQITLYNSIAFDTEIKIDIPTGYDTIYFYKSTTASVVEVEAYVADKNPLTDQMQQIKDGIEDELGNPRKLVASQQKANGNLSLQVLFGSGAKVVNMKNISAGPKTCSIYFIDSSGTNPQLLWKHDVPFNMDIFVTIPAGYDSLLFYSWTSIVNLDVEIYLVNSTSTAYKIEMCEGALPFKNKKIICFGDSITQFKTDGKGYPDYLGAMANAEIVNAGIGGTHYSIRTDVVTNPTTSTEAYAALDMYNLVHSWIENDYTAVDNAVTFLNAYNQQVTDLKANPISGIDVAILFAGTNDWTWGASEGTINNNDPKTILGALSMIIEELLTAKPTLKIFVLSPTVRWIDYAGAGSDPDKFSDVRVIGGKTLKELSNDIITACTNLHTPICDLYNTLGWNMYNFSGYFEDSDGTHPKKGYDSLAKRVYAFLVSHNW